MLLEKIIEICANDLFRESETIEGLRKSEFEELLLLATKDSHYIFYGTFYKQIDDVTKGSPLAPALTNAFVTYHKKIWLEDCPLEFRPFYYRMYANDIFVLFNLPEHLNRFQNYLNSSHVNISFAKENEKDRISFLDVNIIHEQGKFTTSGWRKPTFRKIYTHYDSFFTIHLQNWHDSQIAL